MACGRARSRPAAPSASEQTSSIDRRCRCSSATIRPSSSFTTAWPVADERLLQHDTVELVLQVNGKVRDRIEVPAGLSEDELVERARASEKVRAHLNGEEQRVVVVPDKLVNIVV